MAASYSRILVVVDPDAAESPALDRARRFTASAGELHLFASLYDPALSGDHFFDSKRLQKSRKACLQRVEKALRKRAASLGRGRAELHVDVAWGKPFYRRVLAKAARVDADLLIIGQHDRSGEGYSNSEWHLVRGAACPLLIARHRDWARQPVVLASVDPAHRHDKPAALDRRLIEHADRLARATKGSFRVFFAYDKTALAELGLRGVAVESRLKQLIRKIAERTGLTARQIDVAAADPLEAIPECVQQRKADVVVLGAISRSLIGRVLVGSTAERLLTRMGCDALIVKPPGFVAPVD